MCAVDELVDALMMGAVLYDDVALWSLCRYLLDHTCSFMPLVNSAAVLILSACADVPTLNVTCALTWRGEQSGAWVPYGLYQKLVRPSCRDAYEQPLFRPSGACVRSSRLKAFGPLTM